MRIAVPDLISNSYFPAIAALELGFFESEGLDAELELVFPVPRTWRRCAMAPWISWLARRMRP